MPHLLQHVLEGVRLSVFSPGGDCAVCTCIIIVNRITVYCILCVYMNSRNSNHVHHQLSRVFSTLVIVEYYIVYIKGRG